MEISVDIKVNSCYYIKAVVKHCKAKQESKLENKSKKVKKTLDFLW